MHSHNASPILRKAMYYTKNLGWKACKSYHVYPYSGLNSHSVMQFFLGHWPTPTQRIHYGVGAFPGRHHAEVDPCQPFYLPVAIIVPIVPPKRKLTRQTYSFLIV